MSEIKRQKKEQFQSEHTSSQIWCYLKFERWRDGKTIGSNTHPAKFCVISNLRDQKWDEEMKTTKNKFGPNICQAKSDVISNLRDEEGDEEMKSFFLVQTYVKPNLVLSQIWEMKNEMKK